jgi:hypothetical protein
MSTSEGATTGGGVGSDLGESLHEVTAKEKAQKVEHFSVAERAARGKAARAEVPRRAHGVWEPSASTALAC